MYCSAEPYASVSLNDSFIKVFHDLVKTSLAFGIHLSQIAIKLPTRQAKGANKAAEGIESSASYPSF
jgi:hypothetical protein